MMFLPSYKTNNRHQPAKSLHTRVTSLLLVPALLLLLDPPAITTHRIHHRPLEILQLLIRGQLQFLFLPIFRYWLYIPSYYLSQPARLSVLCFELAVWGRV